jgi:hypothetical protein
VLIEQYPERERQPFRKIVCQPSSAAIDRDCSGRRGLVDIIAGVLLAALCWIAAARFFGADQPAADDVTAGSRHRAGVAAVNPSIAQA